MIRQASISEIKDSIIAPIKAARLTSRGNETPGGQFPGVSVERVVKVACEILGRCGMFD